MQLPVDWDLKLGMMGQASVNLAMETALVMVTLPAGAPTEEAAEAGANPLHTAGHRLAEVCRRNSSS